MSACYSACTQFPGFETRRTVSARPGSPVMASCLDLLTLVIRQVQPPAVAAAAVATMIVVVADAACNAALVVACPSSGQPSTGYVIGSCFQTPRTPDVPVDFPKSADSAGRWRRTAACQGSCCLAWSAGRSA